MRHNSFPRWLLITLALVVLALLAGGYWFYRAQRLELWRQAEEGLQATAQLKADQIATWRKERLADAAVLRDSPFFSEAVNRWLADPQADLTEDILARFRGLHEHYGYSDAFLVDTDGEIRLSLSGTLGPLADDVAPVLEAAWRGRQPLLTDLHLDPGGTRPHISAITPIFQNTDPHAEPAGAVVLLVDASAFLFPLIHFWPTASDSAETLLVRRDGDDVLALNDLRHRPNTALTFRLPLTQTELPAVQAALGAQGFVEGRDYRGVEVLAVVQAIPDSPWFMIAKVDKAEIMAEWQVRARLILSLILGALAAVIVAGRTIWERNEKLHYLKLFQTEKARQESEARYYTVLLSIGDGTIMTDAEGRVELLNPVAEELTGWSLDEARGQPLEEIFRIINEETRQPVENPARRVTREGVVVGLANHTLLIAKDGREVPIADSGAPIFDAGSALTGVVLVFRDQSDERAAQNALLASEERYKSLFQNNHAVMLVIDPATGNIVDANPAACAYYGWSHAALCRMRISDISMLPPDEISGELERARREESYHFFSKQRRADGSIRHVEIFSGPIEIQGKTLLYSIYHDITDRVQAEEQVRLNESRLQSLVRISQYDAEDAQQLLDYALYEALSLTGSKFGYIYHYDNERQIFILNSWSEGVMEECAVIEPKTLYELDKTGIWGEAVRQRKPIIVNDFQAAHPLKKGYPEGHVDLHRFLTVPVFRGSQIVAVVGVANKASDYTQTDVWQLSLLTDSVWKLAERKETEEALRRSEERFQVALKNSGIIVAATDAELRYTWIHNPHPAFDPAGTIGKRDNELVDPDNAKGIMDIKREVLATGKGVRREFMITLPDGPHWYDYTAEPLKDASGQVIGMTTAGIEVTERKLASEALRQHNRRLSILNQVGTALAETHMLPRIFQTAYDHVSQMVDCPRFSISLYHAATHSLQPAFILNDGVQTDASSIPPLVLDEDWLLDGRARAVFTQQPEITARPSALPSAGPDAAGAERSPSSALYVPMVVSGQTIGLLEAQSYRQDAFGDADIALLGPVANQIGLAIENARLFADLEAERNSLERRVAERTAELNHSKERIEAILNSSSDVMIMCGTNGRIEDVNPAFATIFECASNKAIDQPLTALVVPAHKDRLDEAFDTALQIQQPQRLEVTVRCPNRPHHTEFDADIVLSPIVEHDGTLLGVVCSLRDMTSHKLMEAQLRQMLSQAMEFGEIKSRFVSMAVHDLRNPLAVIQSSANMIQRYGDRLAGEKLQEQYERIQTSIQVMVETLDDVLTLSKAESGALAFQPAPLDVIDFCHNMATELNEVVGTDSRVVFAAQGDCRVARLDVKLVRQILSNLLSNALKYSPEDRSVHLTVRCGPDQTVLHVQDRGIGIPEEDQERLFEAFHRAENARQIPGTGLGLAIVKRSVELHGGTITYESREGVGTAFTVVLPQHDSGGAANEENPGH